MILDHEGGKGALARRNKIAAFNREDDAIFSDSTRELGNSVKDTCAAEGPGEPQKIGTQKGRLRRGVLLLACHFLRHVQNEFTVH